MFLSIFVASISMADGKYFGPRAQIREPDMPRQRALITYKGGVETLVVESVVEGEASEMAWVVPVPSEPKEVGSATPGTVGTLPFLLRPDVLQVYPLWLPMFGVIAIVLLLYSYWRVGCKRVTAGWFIAEYLMMFIVCAGTVIVFFPVFAQAKGSSDAGFSNWREVERMEVAVVGSHEVKSVAGWLTANGFSISEDEARVIDDYENDGWRFVVSRVKSGGGLASPKPLRVVFETDRAVYPMALTGAGLDRIHVDLCVVGDAAAHTRGFTAYETAVWDNEEPLTKHPEIAKYVWDGAFVTRLVADVSGSALHRDAYIEFGGGVGKGKVVARNAIAGKTLEVIMASLLFFMIVVGAVVRGKGWSRARFAMYGVGGPLLIGARRPRCGLSGPSMMVQPACASSACMVRPPWPGSVNFFSKPNAF